MSSHTGPADPPPKYITAPMLADALGVDGKTINTWADAGKLPGVQRDPSGAGWRRWSVKDAAEVLRKTGAEVPAAWGALAVLEES